ncbi:glutathione S-transferase [Lutibaculum baratangense]|uniref:Glutathione S-transferase family protein n=1 Tax=Lutibaculum baratangense AMV1 TaxID=631454 RepID=V4R4P7_9HYPH|nr:glutathione S-transferase [Lutibaculum baratangense]ESR26897.1 Glutathione S-transferase family protein [Lutibaculum baratangense AMV1]
MLTLRSSPASPFGRKVKVAAAHLGLADRIEVVQADTSDPEDNLRTQNPLGKIPVLVLEDGTTLFDSRVIVEYLDHLAGGGKIIPQGQRRFAALTLQALADGILDAAILQVYEGRFRPEEKAHQPWLDRQAGKIERALDALERNLPGDDIDIGTITLACALEYLDFRQGRSWRDGRPGLVQWLEAFPQRLPAFPQSAPS